MSGRERAGNAKTDEANDDANAVAAKFAELVAAKAEAIAKADEILAELHTPVNKLKRLTVADINAAGRKYWAQPESHDAYAWIASEELRQLEKSMQGKAGSDTRRKKGITTLDLVRSEAAELQKKFSLRRRKSTRQDFARLIAPKIKCSEEHTLKLLRKLKIPT